MGLTEDERKAVVSLRLNNAKQTLQDAKIIANNKLWKAAANRLYYACFYAAGALMVRFGFEAKSHSGIIRLLGQHFVSKQLISNELGDTYYKLFALRQRGDYDDWIVVKESDVISLLDPAENFIKTVEKLIEENQKISEEHKPRLKR